MPALTRDRAREFKQRAEVKEIEIPELGEGETAYIRKLPAGVILNHPMYRPNSKFAPVDQMAQLLVMALCDEAGEPILEDPGDLETVKAWPVGAVVNTAIKVNRFLGLDQELETVAKNLLATRQGSKRID